MPNSEAALGAQTLGLSEEARIQKGEFLRVYFVKHDILYIFT